MPKDSRTLRRRAVGLALIAAPLALLAVRVLAPYLAADDTAANLRVIVANESLMLGTDLLGLLGILLLVPAAMGAYRLARERSPRLAAVAVGLFVPGWLLVLGMLALDRAVRTVATSGMPEAEAVALAEAMGADPVVGVFVGGFVAGHTIGTLLLGLALARSRRLAAWAGAAVALSAVLHPVAFVVLGSQALDVVANALLLLGLGAAGVRVLAMTDAEWEPAPALGAVPGRPEPAAPAPSLAA